MRFLFNNLVMIFAGLMVLAIHVSCEHEITPVLKQTYKTSNDFRDKITGNYRCLWFSWESGKQSVDTIDVSFNKVTDANRISVSYLEGTYINGQKTWEVKLNHKDLSYSNYYEYPYYTKGKFFLTISNEIDSVDFEWQQSLTAYYEGKGKKLK